jgi:transcriptional antiterminator NusG
VKVTSGPLADFDGTVAEVNPETGKIRVTVTIFGRETPVDLTIDQVASIN